MILAEKQIKAAFEQAEKERLLLSKRTIEGMNKSKRKAGRIKRPRAASEEGRTCKEGESGSPPYVRGNTFISSRELMNVQVHPRMCGEYTSASRRIGRKRQSPACRTNRDNSYIKFISYRLFYRLFLF